MTKIIQTPTYASDKKYLFVCMLGKCSQERQMKIKKIAETKNLEIIDLFGSQNKKLGKCGPAEFLYYIKNASLVVADSFHAIVFSLIFNTPCIHATRNITKSDKNMTTRLSSLEEFFNIKFPQLQEMDNINNLPEFNYKNIESIISKERAKSFKYLISQFSRTKANNLDEVRFNCCGCGHCANVCPHRAIDIVKNEKGFYQYKINDSKCKHCKVCVATCPALTKYEKINFKDAQIMGLSKKTELLDNSSSAGIFGAVASQFISNGGIVYALKYLDENTFTRVDNIEDLEALKGSKYYQSNISTIYENIEKDLKLGSKVLVCGTPCQMAGINKKFKKNTNLYTIQIICHGTPSKDTLNKYCLETFKEEPSNINFRKKDPNWAEYGLEYQFQNKSILKNKNEDIWFQNFIKNNFLNNCCYDCNFAGKELGTDLILGDFWGIDKIDKRFHNINGTSICVCKSEKGQELLSHLEDYNCKKFNNKLKEIIKYNPCLIKTNYPKNKQLNQEYFYINDRDMDFIPNIQEINNNGFVKKQSFVNRLLKKIKRIIKK